VPVPLFVTGPARSGSTLLARLLDASPLARVASDPFFPLYRSLRNGLLRAAGIDALPPSAPLQDWYFTDERIRMLDAIQAADLEAPLAPGELEELRAATAARAEHEAPEIVPHLGGLRGATYRELYDSALAVVAHTRPGAQVVGTKEVWTIDFVAPLARAYPEARFVVIERDPRAILASLEALAARDPTQAAHPLSYARHCRKYAAFAYRLRDDPRVHAVRYEDLVRDPEPATRALCRFLSLPFDAGMLDLAWPGNSSFQAATAGVDATLAERWRGQLAPAQLALAELVCWPELGLSGYDRTGADGSVREHLDESDGWPVSWRSDLGDPARDHACELERARLLREGGDAAAIRRAFLFEDVYEALR
jgi:hypothetical protein